MRSEPGIVFESKGDSVCVRIPMKIKTRGGRKEIIAPEGLRKFSSPGRTVYQEALVIALARAHRLNDLLESGKYGSVIEMAKAMGLERSYVARLLRFTLLAPDIVEAILEGREPSGFSIGKLISAIPTTWEEQREKYGFGEADCD
ncbi:MAG: hypothetical protein ABFD49_07250 [Armatimonadota bacterium]|nr:hypothetical protein [bacterium]